MQGSRVKVLVGSTRESFEATFFEVPYGLLKQYSSSFGKIRYSNSTESGDQIELPDVSKSTFEDFFIWLHAYEPTVSHTCGIDADSINNVLDLAIFAQRYHICLLKNQTSDVLRAALSNGGWKVTPDAMLNVYKAMPAGSVLRQLCFLGFIAVTDSEPIDIGSLQEHSKDGKSRNPWEAVFNYCPSLGWDYFQHKSTGEADNRGIESGGACRFHDHSDVSGWTLQDEIECPYPRGAPLAMVEDEAISTNSPVAREHNETAATIGVQQFKDETLEEVAAEETKEAEHGEAELATEPTEIGSCSNDIREFESEGATENQSVGLRDLEEGVKQEADVEKMQEDLAVVQPVSGENLRKNIEELDVEKLPEEQGEEAKISVTKQWLQMTNRKNSVKEQEPELESVTEEPAKEKEEEAAVLAKEEPKVADVEPVVEASPMQKTMSQTGESKGKKKGKKGKKSF
jgi:hypothetical protein